MFELPARSTFLALLVLDGYLLFAALAVKAIPFPTPAQNILQIQLDPSANAAPTKSIAIVGAGSAGLAALKTLLDLPAEVGHTWEIIVFEAREGIGGVWLEDPNEPQPPKLPESPLYPDLHTNTPHTFMAFPGTPFPPMTPLWPHWTHVYDYYTNYAEKNNLIPYVQLNTSVSKATWVGNSTLGNWNITIHTPDGSKHRVFDHLVVATGINRFPYIPEIKGQQEWLQNRSPSGTREFLHSTFWRHPEDYRGRTVLVLGGGGSGRDLASRSGLFAEKTYISLKPNKTVLGGIPPYVTPKPEVSHLTPNAVVFEDGSVLEDIDTILLGTGYEKRVPLLSAGGALTVDSLSAFDISVRQANILDADNATALTTNLRYIYPLHRHIFSLSSQYPTNALAFIGLLSHIAHGPANYVQAFFAAHSIANSSLLPAREEMLQELADEEALLRSKGFDPYREGHQIINVGGTTDRSQDYQDGLVDYLKSRGAIEDDGEPYVEGWRRWLSKNGLILRRGWERIEAAGQVEVERWLKGVETEQEWYALMRRVVEWELGREREEVND